MGKTKKDSEASFVKSEFLPIILPCTQSITFLWRFWTSAERRRSIRYFRKIDISRVNYFLHPVSETCTILFSFRIWIALWRESYMLERKKSASSSSEIMMSMESLGRHCFFGIFRRSDVKSPIAFRIVSTMAMDWRSIFLMRWKKNESRSSWPSTVGREMSLLCGMRKHSGSMWSWQIIMQYRRIYQKMWSR